MQQIPAQELQELSQLFLQHRMHLQQCYSVMSMRHSSSILQTIKMRFF